MDEGRFAVAFIVALAGFGVGAIGPNAEALKLSKELATRCTNRVLSCTSTTPSNDVLLSCTFALVILRFLRFHAALRWIAAVPLIFGALALGIDKFSPWFVYTISGLGGLFFLTYFCIKYFIEAVLLDVRDKFSPALLTSVKPVQAGS